MWGLWKDGGLRGVMGMWGLWKDGGLRGEYSSSPSVMNYVPP